MSSGKIIILTGEIQSGKTSLCKEVSLKAKEAGVQLSGLISPAVFTKGEKTGIDIINLKNGERRRLAVLRDGEQTGLETKRWSFLNETLQWGNQVLENVVPCDLLIVDELGPLEFDRGKGWVSGLKAVDSGEYQVALLVIRQSLIDKATSRWNQNISRIIDLSDPQSAQISGDTLFSSLEIQS